MNEWTMDNTLNFLEGIQYEVTKQMVAILDRENRNASRKLRTSLLADDAMVISRTNTGFIIKMKFASHGKYVLDNRRRIKSQYPSKGAIASIKQWILDKGISVGGGRIRTPLKKTSSRGGQFDLEPKHTSYSKDKELTKFAFAIFYNIKKRGRTWSNKTNFLRPYENLVSSSNSSFKNGMVNNLAKDGIKIITKDILGGKATIKIKM